MTDQKNAKTGIYMHVPFCVSKCPYCDFYSVPQPNDEMKDRYVDAVIREMKNFSVKYGGGIQADTLYFGGGTPSLLGGHRLAVLIEQAAAIFSLDKDSEITLEANPADHLKDVFFAFSAAGGNRLSLGMQSSDPVILQALGRRHTPDDVRRTVWDAFDSGLANLSLDMMLGVPKQGTQQVEKDAAFCKEMGASHVSAYLLKVEPNTPFYTQKNTLSLPDDDVTADLYLKAVSCLERQGFAQYEISNFSRPEKQSRHNLKYWNTDSYLGFGPAAHSFFDGKRFFYPRDLSAFLDGNTPILDQDGDIAVGSEQEYGMLRLRLTEGLTEKGFYEIFGKPIPALWRENAKKFPSSLLNVTDERIAFTPQGFLVSNGLMLAILNL